MHIWDQIFFPNFALLQYYRISNILVTLINVHQVGHLSFWSQGCPVNLDGKRCFIAHGMKKKKKVFPWMVLHILPSNLVESPLFFYFLMHVIISFSFHMKGFPCPSLFAISLSWKYFFFSTSICKLAQSKGILFSCAIFVLSHGFQEGCFLQRLLSCA